MLRILLVSVLLLGVFSLSLKSEEHLDVLADGSFKIENIDRNLNNPEAIAVVMHGNLLSFRGCQWYHFSYNYGNENALQPHYIAIHFDSNSPGSSSNCN